MTLFFECQTLYCSIERVSDVILISQAIRKHDRALNSLFRVISRGLAMGISLALLARAPLQLPQPLVQHLGYGNEHKPCGHRG